MKFDSGWVRRVQRLARRSLNEKELRVYEKENKKKEFVLGF